MEFIVNSFTTPYFQMTMAQFIVSTMVSAGLILLGVVIVTFVRWFLNV
jgi:hypothetical protein